MKTLKQKNNRYIDHIQNTSPCKTSFSFSKSSRFLPIKSQTPNKFYNLTNTQTKRATSMGYGRKSNLQLKNVNDPGLYNIKSNFDNRSHHSTHQSTFGESHTKIYNRMIKQKKNPGPGQYNPQNTAKARFYIGQKLKINRNQDKLSPQHYNIHDQLISKLSQFHNRREFRIHTEGNEKQDKNRLMPGPGYYNIAATNSIEQIMKKNKMRSTFSRTNRLLPIHTQTDAGPGSYAVFSAFGTQQDD